MKKKLLIIIPIAAAVIAAWLAFCGYQWSWGPFVKLHDVKPLRSRATAKSIRLIIHPKMPITR